MVGRFRRLGRCSRPWQRVCTRSTRDVGNARTDIFPSSQRWAAIHGRPSAVTGARRARILAELADTDGAVTSVRLGEVCMSVTGMAGAGIMLMTGNQPPGVHHR